MLKYQSDKIFTPKGSGFHRIGFAVFVSEGHMGTIVFDDIPIADDTPVTDTVIDT
jgi:hypothetical protein